MKKFFNKIHYSDSLSLAGLSVKFLLIPFSLLYLAIIHIRNFLYEKKVLKQVELSAKVISVGNLTTGGTGKTPVVIEFARYLKEKTNKKIVVLSHGYGGKLYKKGVNVISNGNKILLSAELAGDEAYIIAENLKGVPVICGKNRIEAGKLAIKKFGAEIILLDDGFQHLRLKRDLNILLFDCSLICGNGFILPAGPLREPLSEIKRADKVIMVNKNSFNSSVSDLCNSFTSKIRLKFNKPAFSCSVVPDKIIRIKDSKTVENSGLKVFAFAGVANPSSFFSFIEKSGFIISGKSIFDDHYNYTEKDIEALIKEAHVKKADCLVTTEKDAVKIKDLITDKKLGIDFYFLKVSLDIDTGEILNDIL